MAEKDKNPKLDQFVKELNTLKDKYQYNLIPSLEVTTNGIVPVLKITDKVPPIDPKKAPVPKPNELKKERA